MPMSLSQNGLSFIIAEEGVSSTMYNDNVGHCTVGIGHLVHKGNCDYPTQSTRKGFSEDAPYLPNLDAKTTANLDAEKPYFQPMTNEQARELLRQDLARFEAAVNNQVKVELNQHQFDALVSFAFNVGVGAFKSSTLLKVLNKGKYEQVPGEMKRWTKSDGKVNNVLVKRRAREAEL
jgi:lysozyme